MMDDQKKGFDDIGFAKVDYLRRERIGQPEVIFCQGKTPEQVLGIIQSMLRNGSNVFGTKVTEETYAYVTKHIDGIRYNPVARTISLIRKPEKETESYIAVVSAGTSDLPVVEEACETAIFLGNKVEKIVDVGIAGIHRLFDKLERIRGARVVIVVAGMEGALASVVAALVSSPVIAVPTSVGYGAHLNGIAALLSMLNSCSSLCVVNIDNGYGAACQASKINRITDAAG
jgi:NCAIR mutase (PurE)-related protein